MGRVRLLAQEYMTLIPRQAIIIIKYFRRRFPSMISVYAACKKGSLQRFLEKRWPRGSPNDDAERYAGPVQRCDEHKGYGEQPQHQE